MAVYSRIAGTGSGLPEKILTNQDLEKFVETSDEWIVTRTGIRTRRIVEGDQAASDLAVPAAEAALREAGISAPWCDTVIPASNAGAEKLATDPRVAFLSFIGLGVLRVDGPDLRPERLRLGPPALLGGRQGGLHEGIQGLAQGGLQRTSRQGSPEA